MGSTLHVRLCPHKVWREKYGCAKCDAEERLAAPFEQRVECGKPYSGGTCRLVRGHAGHCQD